MLVAPVDPDSHVFHLVELSPVEEREKDEREKDERRDSLMMPVPRRASAGHPLEKSATSRCPVVKGVQKSASTSQLTLLIPNAGQSPVLDPSYVIVSVSPVYKYFADLHVLGFYLFARVSVF